MLWMTGGAAAIGLSGFVFLSAVGHGHLDPAVAAALSSVYLLSNILGPGVFVAVEHETSRRVSTAVGPVRPGQPGGGTGRATVLLTLLTLVLLFAGGQALLQRVLRGDPALLVALAVAVIGSAAVFRVRGLLGGRRLFRRYAGSLLVDAGVRIVGVLVLVTVGSTSGAAFALALCFAPGVAAVLTRPTGRFDDGDRRGVPAAIGLLLGASLLSMAVANLAPVLVNAALPDDPARAFAFACTLVLTRAPLLLMGPVQAMLLPTLTAAALRGDAAEIRRQLRRGLTVVAGLGVLAVGLAATLGRPVLRLLFGPAADGMPTGVVAALTLSAMLLMAVALMQPALVALGGHRTLITGWACGAVVFGAVFAALAGGDPVTAAVAATVAAPAVALTVQLAVGRLY
jgi:O-antigen/teichoic acid export membrane protein